MSNITKETALKIAHKLDAKIDTKKSKHHDIAIIYHGEKFITSFGIRRGSKKDAGHGHIPSCLYWSPYNTLLLGQCPKTKNDWIENLKEKGLL